MSTFDEYAASDVFLGRLADLLPEVAETYKAWVSGPPGKRDPVLTETLLMQVVVCVANAGLSCEHNLKSDGVDTDGMKEEK